MRIIVLAAVFICGALTPAVSFSQQSVTEKEGVDVKNETRAQRRALVEAENEALYTSAVQALKDKQFVLEADRLIFKQGDVAYVNSNTNFVMVNGETGSVQVAFVNSPFAGPNGIGGVTVEGTVSAVKVKKSKKGSITYSFNVQGVGISAQIFLTLNGSNNRATVTVNPNFNSQTLTLQGELVPLKQSKVFKARSL